MNDDSDYDGDDNIEDEKYSSNGDEEEEEQESVVESKEKSLAFLSEVSEFMKS
jgi:hypothetical protein